MSTAERPNVEIRREYHRLAVSYLEQSDFPRLTDVLATNHNNSARSLDEGMQKATLGLTFETWREEFGGENEVLIRLAWDRKILEDGRIQAKSIEIAFEPDGMIYVHGGILGSTPLLLNGWRGNPDIQQQALLKAYSHPIIEIANPTSRHV